jgi:hypothetical protein
MLVVKSPNPIADFNPDRSSPPGKGSTEPAHGPIPRQRKNDASRTSTNRRACGGVIVITSAQAQHSPKRNTTPAQPTLRSSSATSCPVAGRYRPPAIGRAEAAYFRKINAEGGINGRKINFIS